MAKNFGGLGIGIDVDADEGGDSLRDIGSTVDKLWKGLIKAGKAAPEIGKSFQRNLGGLGASGSRAFGAVTMAMGNMIDKAMSPELDHAYSSMYAGFNKSFSALTAGMNVTEKEMAKARRAIGGAAFGMGEDMEQAAENWIVFEKQGLKLNEILGTKGLTGTVKQLIKVTSVYGVQGEQLAQVMGSLVKGFDFTEDAVAGLADKMVASGKVFNMGREAIQAWPSILESLNNELADFGKTLNPQQIEKLTLSIVQLGGGLKDALGLAPQQAIELARTMFTTIAGERKNIINMFRGMGGEFGDVAKGLMESGGDVNKMFALMSEGDPLKFMDVLRQMAAEAQKRGGETGIAFQRLSGVMTQALGPDVAFAMKGNWDKARESMAAIPKALRGSEGLFTRIADEHWKSSITAGEAWDRMIQGMRARLFRLSEKDVGAWKKQMKEGFEGTFEALAELSSDKGPLGELTRRLLAVERVGLSAFIPGMSALAPLLGGIATSSLPVLTALGSMGLRFSALGGMAMKGGALFGLFYLLKHGPKKAIANIKGLGKQIWESLGKIFPTLEKRIQSLGSLKSVFQGVGGMIGRLVKEIDWGDLAKTLASVASKVFVVVGETVSALIKGIFSPKDPKTGAVLEANMTSVFSGALVGAFSAVKDLARSLVVGFFKDVFSSDSIKEGLGKLKGVFTGALTGLLLFSGKFRKKFLLVFQSMFRTMLRTSTRGWSGMVAQAKFGMAKMGKVIKAGARMIPGIGLFLGIMEGLNQIGVRMKNISKIMTDELIPDFEKTALAGAEAFKGVLSTIDAVLLGIPGMIGEAMGITESHVDGFYVQMMASAERGMAYVSNIFSGTVDMMKIAFDTFINVVKKGWGVAELAGEVAAKSMGSVWTNIITRIEGALDSFLGFFNNIFVQIRHGIELGFYKVRGVLVGIIDKIPRKFLEMAGVESLAEFSADFKKYNRAMGGEVGLIKRQQDELDDIAERALVREKSRADERKRAQEGAAKALKDLKKGAGGFPEIIKAGIRRGTWVGIKQLEVIEAELASIERGYAPLAAEVAAPTRGKKAAPSTTEPTKRKKPGGPKGKKGVGAPGGQGPAAGAPGGPPGRPEMMVKDMMAVLQGQQTEMIKRMDVTNKLLAESPVEKYVQVGVKIDGREVAKSMQKQELKKAGGRGNR